jgi:hypothetical protein
MKNVTITIPEAVARWARVWAAQQDMSLSRCVSQLLAERMQEEAAYDRAQQEFLSGEPMQLREAPQPYPRRDELHER